ncbi:hypothetical protein BGX38DRAFT_1226822 [Terfezia claveryi]|nr:hypothetical protein BGX38DRAFT_1226822 [Terfezia claveryi]
MRGIRTEVGNLRTEVGNLHTEVGNLHTEVGNLRTEESKQLRQVNQFKSHQQFYTIGGVTRCRRSANSRVSADYCRYS